MPKSRSPIRRDGFVLVAILVIVMLLSMLVISLLFRFKAEDIAASSGLAKEQAWAAMLSGVQEAMRVAATAPQGSLDWQNNERVFKNRFVYEDGADQWFFSVFSPAPADELSTYVFGISDEAGRLNLNIIESDQLSKLPGMKPALGQAIDDFVDEDDLTRAEGAEQDYYSGLPIPYTIHNRPLESVEELRLVKGFSPALLNGETKIKPASVPADSSRRDSEERATSETVEARQALGLSQYFCVNSSEPDETLDGKPRVNLNSGNAEFPEVELPPGLTNFITMARSNHIKFKHAADLLEASLKVKDEKGAEMVISSGVGKEDLSKVLDLFSASPSWWNEGLVNINTASAAVLNTIPGFDEPLTETVTSTRRGLSSERRSSIAWLFQEGLVDAARFKTIAPFITTKSLQFRFRVIGFGLPSGRFCMAEVAIDVSGGQRKITYLRDITRNGLPFSLQGEEEGVARSPGSRKSSNPTQTAQFLRKPLEKSPLRQIPPRNRKEGLNG